LIAIVDAGPLYAALDVNDRAHQRSADVLRRRDLELVVPSLVVAEVCYFAGKNLDAEIEAAFLRSPSASRETRPIFLRWLFSASWATS
jgi:predicted nucleic acid-binding protein